MKRDVPLALDPMSGLPPGAVDAIHSTIDLHFGFLDRLRILFGWRVTLKYSAYLPVAVSPHYPIPTAVNVAVWREPLIPRGSGGGFVHAPKETTS